MKKSIKSVFEAMEDIKGVLVAAGIGNMLSGEIRIASRKLGSISEDIVINSLIYDAEQRQSGIFNVNVHVPNLKNQPSANPTAADNTQPNIARMKAIGEPAATAMDCYNGFDFSLKLRSPGEVESNGTEWFYNIQVIYDFLRIDTAG